MAAAANSAAQEERAALAARWADALERAVQCESWGQKIESVEEYERLARSLGPEHVQLATGAERRRLDALQGRVAARGRLAASATAAANEAGPTLVDMEDVAAALRAFFSSAADGAADGDSSGSEDDDAARRPAVAPRSQAAAESMRAGLLPPPRRSGATQFLCVTLLRVGVRNALAHQDPWVRVSVLDDRGVMLESQRTPPAALSGIGEQFIVFDQHIYIHVPFHELCKQGAGVALELMHYKPKKRKQSCRCWALLETDEVMTALDGGSALTGEVNLELYKKPMDPVLDFRLHPASKEGLYMECVVELLGG